VLKLGAADFTIGRAKFVDTAPWASDATPKIYVKITPQDLDGMILLAALAAGAPWSILDGEVAESLNLLNGEGDVQTVTTWRGRIEGRLERVGVRLHADEGDSLDLEATFLISRGWRGNLLGYGGLLQHIRFAVDATNNLVYFGSSESAQ
jgi:hypothetical protein